MRDVCRGNGGVRRAGDLGGDVGGTGPLAEAGATLWRLLGWNVVVALNGRRGRRVLRRRPFAVEPGRIADGGNEDVGG